MIEVSVLVVGWLLGGPAGIGTAIHALLIGTAMQWAFKVFHVQPHRQQESPISPAESAADSEIRSLIPYQKCYLFITEIGI